MPNQFYPLLVILIGAALVLAALGPFQTLDTDLEFATTQGVLRWGYPYYNAWGNLFNEPPLGFYTAAVFLYVVGVTIQNGVALISAFGLACIVMVYLVGKELYSKSTGVFAAAFFALAPWQLILSRSFLIDTQCLFLSLIFLYFGILAIRRDSVKLAGVSGIFFALALLTKLFAVFMLVPLLLLYLYQRPKNLKRILAQVGAFSLPAVGSTLLWYQVINGKELLYLVQHNDFMDLNFPEVVASPTFIPNFLVYYGLGLFFVAAALFAVAVGMVFWKRFSKRWLVADLVCLVTVLVVLGLVTYLAVTLNLKAPYTSAIKYAYQSLPFFGFLAGSLATKSGVLIKAAKQASKTKEVVLLTVGLAGVALVMASLIANMDTARDLASASFLIFRVQPDVDIGYSFHVDNPTSPSSPLMVLQLIGFVLVLSGLLYASRNSWKANTSTCEDIKFS
ncbi:MAG: glycosyltransferase family 39 protein [Candidatus Bathyarchaeota archaeon]|nr:glycosyltransferase family 39 protein [Candidatus Bathyarchaeota archaeon]